MTRPRLLPRGHPDRPLSAEEVIEPAYQSLVLRMMTKGLSEQEIAVAVESLAQAHLDTLVANAATEAQIAKARHEAGLPEIVERPPPRDGWMPIAAVVLWCAMLGPPLYIIAMWWLG